MDETDTNVPQEMPRRKLLGWLVGLINVVVAGVVVVPTAAFLATPLLRRRPKVTWVPVLKDSELAEGETRAVVYTATLRDGYMVTRRSTGLYLHRRNHRVLALDPTCPHLGCHVRFDPARKQYLCPCHGGIFDESGGRLSGPPPRGLTPLQVKTEDGRIWVQEA